MHQYGKVVRDRLAGRSAHVRSFKPQFQACNSTLLSHPLPQHAASPVPTLAGCVQYMVDQQARGGFSCTQLIWSKCALSSGGYTVAHTQVQKQRDVVVYGSLTVIRVRLANCNVEIDASLPETRPRARCVSYIMMCYTRVFFW